MDDFSKLDFEELLEFRALQRKMPKANGKWDLAPLTLDELKSLERLYLKMANEPYSWERASVHLGADGKWYYENGEPYTWEREPTTKTYCHWCGHVVGAVTHTNNIVPGVYCSEQCLENSQLALQRRRSGVTAASNPPAVAHAEPVTPAQPEKLKLPSHTALSAARQLDSVLRFGYDLPEEPR